MPMPGALPLLLAGSLLAPTAPTDPQTVIGGEPSPTCAWPTTVSMGGCTGTLIHPEVVVYAAHCGADVTSVWFGEQAFGGEGRQVPTAQCWINEGYAESQGARHEDWAFCQLAEPVTDVPIVPPLMGCETTLLTPGRPVTVVGFGLDENGNGGIKRQGETELQWIDEDGAIFAGNGEVGSCFGDSGGPIYLQLPDGSWRVFGIVSGGQECGFPAWYAAVHTAIPTIEQVTGIDVTPCHYTGGGWSPSPVCADTPTEPWDGTGKTWADGCAGGPLVEAPSTCGTPHDPTTDETGPEASIVEPAWGDVFDSDDSGTALVAIEVDASDLPNGVERVVLSIGGQLLEDSPDRDPPFRWPAVSLPPGVWELSAHATDWAGNVSTAPVVMIGVDQEPPAMPEPSGSTGEMGGSSSGDVVGGTAADTTGGGDPGTSSTTAEPEGSSGSSSGSEGTAADDDAGCGCTSSGSGGGFAWLGLLALALGRRRRASWILGAALSASGCGDDGSSGGESSGTSGSTSSSTTATDPSSTTNPQPATSGSSSSGGSSSESTASSEDSSSTTAACEPGTEGCGCTEDEFGCGPDLRCELDTCIACPAGTQACHCVPPKGDEKAGTCQGDLLCVADLCAAPPPCPFLEDGVCNEGIGCFPGSDTFDCCPTQPGVCEEVSAGGACPEGSDAEDCSTKPGG